MFHQQKELSQDSVRPLGYIDFTDKNKMAAAKKQSFLCVVCIDISLQLPTTVIQRPGFANDSRATKNVKN